MDAFRGRKAGVKPGSSFYLRLKIYFCAQEVISALSRLILRSKSFICVRQISTQKTPSPQREGRNVYSNVIFATVSLSNFLMTSMISLTAFS